MNISEQPIDQIKERSDIVKVSNTQVLGYYHKNILYLITCSHEYPESLMVTKIPEQPVYNEMREQFASTNSNSFPYILLNPNEYGHERVLAVKKNDELLRFETVIAPRLASNNFQIKYNY